MRHFPFVLASLLRASFAAFLVWTCLQALPAWDARAALIALPNYDYWTEADRLRSEEKFSEALLVVDAGLAAATDPFPVARLQETRARTIAERDDWLRRLGDVGEGVVTGAGDSAEALGGAVAADLFVFGDVRDLVIQGGRSLRGEDVDEVIVALSAAGIVLTTAPSLDFGAAIMKFARRAGAMTERFARQLLRITRVAIDEGNAAPLMDIAGDAATLGRKAEPGAALAILKRIDDPAALKIAAKMARREGGSFALWVGGRPALDLAKAGAEGEALLLRAARKGRRGVDFAADNAGLLIRVHPLIGLVKGFYKHNVPRLLAELLERQLPLILGLLTGWLGFELLRVAHRLGLALRRKPSMARIAPPPEPTQGRVAPRA